MTAHRLHTTASIFLNESGKWSPDVTERSLDHAGGTSVRAIFNRDRSWEERVAMHQWRSDHLDMLRDGAAIVAISIGVISAARMASLT